MRLPDVISFIYFLTCAVYFFYGMLILSRNTKSTMHWLVFCCCLDMSLWAISFAIGNMAPDEASCLVWRRIGSVGWGSMFSYFLHYILLLTGSRLMRKKWIYLLLYVPAVLNIFLYGIYTKTAEASYHLQYTYSGWINVAGNTVLDWYYNVYYVGFATTGIALLLHWGFRSKDAAKRKQAFFIGFSFIFAIILGTLTEYTINAMFQVKVPQMAPVIILIPITIMLYFIQKTGFMYVASASNEPLANQVLSEYATAKLYLYIFVIYMVAGFINFGVMFFSKREPVGAILLFSSVILGFGLSGAVIQNLKIKPNTKQTLSNIILVASIPIMMLKYLSVSAVYAWAVPVILMLVAIAFSQRQLLFFIGGVTLAIYAWIWAYAPVMQVTFTSTDHIARILILCIVLWVVLKINSTYVGLINENKEKIRQEKLFNQVANLFVRTSEVNLNGKIEEALSLCGKHFSLDWIHILFFSPRSEPESQSAHYQWCAPGIQSLDCSCEKGMLQELSLVTEPEKLATEGFLVIANPEEAMEGGLLKQLPVQMGLKSVAIKALRNQNDAIGLLCFGSAGRVFRWEEPQQQAANLLGHLITDIWTRVEAERGLHYQATYDMLTGLPNRTTFVKQLSRAIIMAQQTGKQLGVLFLDMDSFKAVNDSIGHDTGDDVLCQIGKVVMDGIRPGDLLARFGGDEFLVMVPQMQSFEDIAHVANRIMDSLKNPLAVKSQEFHMTASMGIAVYPFDGQDAGTLIKHADLAMYKAKAQGKNQYAFCSDDMKKESIRTIKLTEDLFRALERSELQLYYQPQVHTTSGEIVGAEALLRWFHPEFGMISPGLFIPLAEQTGLIVPIGEWVLKTACLKCRSIHVAGLPEIRVGVNVSILQLHNPGFVAHVKQVLEESELEPRFLELEITESTAVSEDDTIMMVLEKLKALGVSISIDDFGTEYSSLSRLCDMPIDRIKLDIQFIRSIGRSRKENAIIQGIIGIAHSLGLTVVAEGVETEAQLDFLIESKNDEVQGFLFCPPVPPEDLERILRKEERLIPRVDASLVKGNGH